MSFIGRGIITQVLTQTNVGARWLNSAAGIIGALVGSGVANTNYLSMGSAILAGETILNVIGPTLETSDISIPQSGLSVVLFNGARVDLNDSRLTGTDRPVSIIGNGTIRYRRVDQQALCESRLILQGIGIENDSAVFPPLSSADKSKITHCNFTGDCVVSASGTQVHGCNIAGLMVVDESANGVDLSDLQVNGLPIDSGVATTMSNVSFY